MVELAIWIVSACVVLWGGAVALLASLWLLTRWETWLVLGAAAAFAFRLF